MAVRTISPAATTWDNVLSWVEGAVPTSADDVVATALSGNLTINVAAACRSIDLTGYVGILTHGAAITLTVGTSTPGPSNKALVFVAGMIYTLGSATTSAIVFSSTSTTPQDVDFAGKTTGHVTFNGVGGSWKLTGTHNAGTAAIVTLTNGTLNTNGQTCSWGIFLSSNSNTRVLTLGSSSITVKSSASAWQVNVLTGLTITANTAIVTMTGAVANFSCNVAVNYNGMSLVQSGSGTAIIGTGAFILANYTRVGTVVVTDRLSLSGSFTVTGTVTFTGNSAINRLTIQSNTGGTQRTINTTNYSSTNTDLTADVHIVRTIAVGQVVGAQAAQTITPRKSLLLALETQAAQTIRPTKVLLVGQVLESDLAQVLVAVHISHLVQAIEDEIAQQIVARRIVPLELASETDQAQSVTPARTLIVSQVAEIDFAGQVVAKRRYTLGQAIETNEGRAIAPRRTYTIQQVIETDSAGTVSYVRPVTISQAIEVDVAGTFLVRMDVKNRYLLSVDSELGRPRPTTPKSDRVLVRGL